MDPKLADIFLPMVSNQSMKKLERFTHKSCDKFYNLSVRLLRKGYKDHQTDPIYYIGAVCMSLIGVTENLLIVICEDNPIMGDALRSRLKEKVDKW